METMSDETTSCNVSIDFEQLPDLDTEPTAPLWAALYLPQWLVRAVWFRRAL